MALNETERAALKILKADGGTSYKSRLRAAGIPDGTTASLALQNIIRYLDGSRVTLTEKGKRA